MPIRTSLVTGESKKRRSPGAAARCRLVPRWARQSSTGARAVVDGASADSNPSTRIAPTVAMPEGASARSSAAVRRRLERAIARVASMRPRESRRAPDAPARNAVTPAAGSGADGRRRSFGIRRRDARAPAYPPAAAAASRASGGRQHRQCLHLLSAASTGGAVAARARGDPRRASRTRTTAGNGELSPCGCSCLSEGRTRPLRPRRRGARRRGARGRAAGGRG